MENMLQALSSQYTQLLASGLAILAAAAFTISVITEVTKSVSVLKRVPTDLQVIVLSLVFCQLAYLGYLTYTHQRFVWYGPVIALIFAFYVAFLAMYGWEKLTSLWGRFKSPGGSA